jgi:hypothetical protein
MGITIDILTHPTPARLDAPFTMQGRREFERRGVRVGMLRRSNDRERSW